MNNGIRLAFACILSIIIIIGSIMNMLVLVVLWKNKTIRQHIASVFIANLALIDLLNLAFVMPFSVQTVMTGNWAFENTLCQLNGMFGTLFSLASILTLAVISLDRWAAVMKPLVYRARMTPGHAISMTVYVWLQATLFAIAPAIKNWFVVNTRYSSCSFPSGQLSTGFSIYMGVSVVMNIGLSLVIILVTYFCVFRVARSHSRRIAVAVISMFAAEHTKLRKETFRQREAKTAIKISFVIGAFLVCHLPYSVMRTLELFGPGSAVFSLSKTFLISVKWTVYLKSAVNPFIYSFLQQRFRKAIIELFTGRRGSNTNFNLAHTYSRNRILKDNQSVQFATTGTTGTEVQSRKSEESTLN